MGRREVKTYEVYCDTYGCQSTATLVGPEWPSGHGRPEGWEVHVVDGGADYSVVVELCPACARGLRERAEENAP